MRTYPYLDIYTFILYFIIGCICIISIHITKGGSFNKYDSIRGFLLLFFILFIFSVFRKVGLYLGGTDSLSYQEDFIYFFNYGGKRFLNTDVLFGVWLFAIRSLTDNPYIFRGLSYGLIILGYIVCIKWLCPQNISPIPFICILVPFMRSINTMRSSMSIALILFSLVCFYKRKYLWCIIWAIGSVLMHRLSFAMLTVFPFIYFARKYLINITKLKIIILIGCLIGISYLLSTLLQQYIILFNLFADNGNADMWYLTKNEGKNILLNWPMYLPHILLFLAFIFQYNRIKLKDDSKIRFIKLLFYFDIIIMPATLVLGLWRFQEYLYIPNLILWAYIIPMFYAKVKTNSRIVLRFIFFIGFAGLMLIRLSREWFDASLMPYLFFWQ